VKVDVGDDRHAAGPDDLLERGGRFHVGARDPDDVDARIFAAADLIDRRLGVGREGIGHRLHRHRRIAPDRDIAHHDLAALTADYVTPRTDRHGGDIAPRAPGC